MHLARADVCPAFIFGKCFHVIQTNSQVHTHKRAQHEHTHTRMLVSSCAPVGYGLIRYLWVFAAGVPVYFSLTIVFFCLQRCAARDSDR